MERFNLNTWLEDKSRKIVTRDGKQARIICYDVKQGKDDCYFRIIALVDKGEEIGEMSYYYSEDGSFLKNPSQTHNLDLFFADEEEELTELQKTLEEDCDYYVKLYNDGNTREELREWIKCWCNRIIDLARNELEKSNPYSGNQKQEWSEEDEKNWRHCLHYIDAYVTPVKEHVNWFKNIRNRIHSQQQQKQEWSEEDENMFNDILLDMADRREMFRFNGETTFAEDTQKKIDWLSSYHLQLKHQSSCPQPQQEWSEEDESQLQNAIDALEFLGKRKEYYSQSGYDAALSAANWLKSIKDRVQPQPKQEWSEEDEKKLNDTIFFLNEFNEVYHDDAQNCINWLKLLKDKFQLHPEETEYISKEEHEKILEQVYKEHDEDLEQAYKNADKVQFNRGMDEVLTNPQKYFHIGDTIRPKNSTAEYTIVSIFNGRYYGDGWSLGIQEAADHYELVKEQDCDLEDTIDLLEAIAEDQEKDYCPYNAATLRKTSSWLKSIKKKQHWTTEDKSMYLRVLGILGKCYMKVLPDKVKEELEWMKGLDERIELNPKQEWSEEDEKMLSQVINEIEAIKSNSSTIFEKNIAQDKIDWLKSFKDRVRPLD